MQDLYGAILAIINPSRRDSPSDKPTKYSKGIKIMNLELIENSQEVQTKFTETAGGYWSGTSVNSELDTQFWEKLVPSKGNADTVHGELLRAASRIYRDMYQNGGGNLIDFVDNGHSTNCV